MSENQVPDIKEFMDGKEKQQRSRTGWVGFVESDVVNFMQLHKLEKMTIDDGAGNKARLALTKDGQIRVDCTSSNLL